jgi:hypothetical protein
MATSYRRLILDYCAEHSVVVPAGFGRNTPCRYVVVRNDQTPPKLVATTWLKKEDVVYYFVHYLIPQIGGAAASAIHILDFKDMSSLRYSGGSRLLKVEDITI